MDDYYHIKPISVSMLHPPYFISSSIPILQHSTIFISTTQSTFSLLLPCHSIIHAFLTSTHLNSQKTMNLHLNSYKHEYLNYAYR